MLNKILFAVSVLLLSGCQAMITKQQAFPNMYSEKPSSILVVPAVNNTTAADAAELYATTIAVPLAEAGYYVFSVPFVEKFLQREGIIDGAQVSNVPVSRFGEMFGADTVLYVTLNNWDTNYYLTGGNVTVSAKFILKSVTSGEILWQYDDIVVHNTSGNSGNFIADLISTAISTATIDYVPIARIVNQRIVASLPVGKYHKRHSNDGADNGVIAERAGQQTE